MSAPSEDLALVLAELKAIRKELEALRGKVSAPLAASVTVEVAAARLGCGRSKVFELLSSGALVRGKRHGRDAMVTVASIEAAETREAPRAMPARPDRPAALPTVLNDEEEQAKLSALRKRLSADSRKSKGTERGQPRSKGRGPGRTPTSF